MDANQNHLEAMKSITEFTKVIVSLATSILTILIGYITLNNIELTLTNLSSSILLLLSIIFSIYGFGRTIPAIKTGNGGQKSILFSNISVLFLVIGIFVIPLINIPPKNSIKNVLSIVQKDTTSLSYNLSPDKCIQVNFQDEIYMLTYNSNGKTVTVKFSTKSNEIIFIG